MHANDSIRPVRMLFLCFALAGLSLFAGACAGFMKPAGNEPKRFTLIVTNGTAGALEPQGCACRHAGGMERRAGCIAAARAAGNPVLVLDSGNLLFAPGETPSRESLLSAGVLLAGIGRIQTAAINVAASDCAAGADFIKKAAGQVVLLSSNLRDAAGGLLFSPHLVTTLNRTRIGVFGLTNPAPSCPDGIHADDPVPAAAVTVKALQRARCDVIVLLSQLSEEQNRSLIAAVPGIHFVLGSSDGPARAEPVRSGDSYAIAPGQRGTHAAVVECMIEGRGPAFIYAGGEHAESRTDMQPARGRFTFRLAALDSSVPADPAVGLLLETFREDRARRRLSSRGLHYQDAVPAADMSGLTETVRRRAVRLMNEIDCENRPIAACAADSQLCRDMARRVAEGVRAGLGDSAVGFSVLREIQSRTRRNDIDLDKTGPVQ